MTDDITSFQGEYRFLSNFWPAPLKVIGIPYLNSEAAYQACKTLDMTMRRQFSNLQGSEAKYLGRTLNIRPDWNDGVTKVECMELCLWAKFAMNQDLKQRLIDTGDRQLIESNTWGDTFWGVCRGKGENVLGQLLMEIRTNIR